jgi:hypothetical protein
VYVTPLALCTVVYWSEGSDGGMGFRGANYFLLRGLDTNVDKQLARHVDRAGLARFASTIVSDLGHGNKATPPVIDVDRPTAVDFLSQPVDWHRDVKACLTHHDGRPYITGTMTISSNTAVHVAIDRPASPAPPTLTPMPQPPFDLAAVRGAFPEALDFFLSPSADLLLVSFPDALRAYDVAGRKLALDLPSTASVVMAEWAAGAYAERWLEMLGLQP